MKKSSKRQGKILIVCQAPSKKSQEAGIAPLSGKVGEKVAALAGTTQADFLQRTERVNLIPEYPGKGKGGDLFPMDQAREAAKQVDGAGHAAVLLLGKNVARAFGVKDRTPLKWFDLQGTPAAILPHPSGVNRWWNTPENKAAAASFLKDLWESGPREPAQAATDQPAGPAG